MVTAGKLRIAVYGNTFDAAAPRFFSPEALHGK